MIIIKGVTKSTIDCISTLLGRDSMINIVPYDSPSLYEVVLNDDILFSAHSKGFIVLNRNGNVNTLTDGDYVEISIA